MRLIINKIHLLKEKLASLSKEAKLYLFGFRVDHFERGESIDLLAISTELTKKDLRKFYVVFFKVFGKQKLDILLDDGMFKNPFKKSSFVMMKVIQNTLNSKDRRINF